MSVSVHPCGAAISRTHASGIQPLGHRGGVYPLVRAGTTVALAEVTWSVLVADVVRGVPSAYVDLAGYDEVDPEADEGAAFEGLIGFHGGLAADSATPSSSPRPASLLQPNRWSAPKPSTNSSPGGCPTRKAVVPNPSVDERRPWRSDFAAIVGLLVVVSLSVALPLRAWLIAIVQLALTATAAIGALHRGYSFQDLGPVRPPAGSDQDR